MSSQRISDALAYIGSEDAKCSFFKERFRFPQTSETADVISKLNGKSTLMVFDHHSEYRDKYGRHF